MTRGDALREAVRRRGEGMVLRLQRSSDKSGGCQTTEIATAYNPLFASTPTERREWEQRVDKLLAAGFRRVVSRRR